MDLAIYLAIIATMISMLAVASWWYEHRQRQREADLADQAVIQAHLTAVLFKDAAHEWRESVEREREILRLGIMHGSDSSGGNLRGAHDRGNDLVADHAIDGAMPYVSRWPRP